MAVPTPAQQREIEDLEDHMATINLLLDLLRALLADARTPKGAARLEREIARQVARLAALHARRDAIRRSFGGGSSGAGKS